MKKIIAMSMSLILMAGVFTAASGLNLTVTWFGPGTEILNFIIGTIMKEHRSGRI